MVGARYQIKWAEHSSKLLSRLNYLLQNELYVDVTLMCSAYELKVHRSVLAACSPYFEREMGYHPLLVIKDIEINVMEALIQFMYRGETSIPEDCLTAFFETAKFFEIRGLSDMIVDGDEVRPLMVKGAESSESACTVNKIECTPGSLTTTTLTHFHSVKGSNRGGRRGRGRCIQFSPVKPKTTNVAPENEPSKLFVSLTGATSTTPWYFKESKMRETGNYPKRTIIKVRGKKNSPDTNGDNIITETNSKPETRSKGKKRKMSNSNNNNCTGNFDTFSEIIVSSKNKQAQSPSADSITSIDSGYAPDVYCAANNRPKLFKYKRSTTIMDDNNVLTLRPRIIKNKNFSLSTTLSSSSTDSSSNEFLLNDQISNNEEELLMMNNDDNASLSLDCPFLIDTGDGNFVSLDNDNAVFNVIDHHNDHSIEEKIINVKNKNIKIDKNDKIEENIKKAGIGTELKDDPDAVVLFKVTDNGDVIKHVLSSEKINELKLLCENMKKDKLLKEKENEVENKMMNVSEMEIEGSQCLITQVINCKENSPNDIGKALLNKLPNLFNNINNTNHNNIQDNKNNHNHNHNNLECNLHYVDDMQHENMFDELDKLDKFREGSYELLLNDDGRYHNNHNRNNNVDELFMYKENNLNDVIENNAAKLNNGSSSSSNNVYNDIDLKRVLIDHEYYHPILTERNNHDRDDDHHDFYNKTCSMVNDVEDDISIVSSKRIITDDDDFDNFLLSSDQNSFSSFTDELDNLWNLTKNNDLKCNLDGSSGSSTNNNRRKISEIKIKTFNDEQDIAEEITLDGFPV